MSLIKLIEGVQKVALGQGKLSELAKTAETSEQRDSYKRMEIKSENATTVPMQRRIRNIESAVQRGAISVKHKNVYGETMTLTMDRDGELWFEHEDCNSEPEKIKDLNTSFEIGGKKVDGFKYILEDDEKAVLASFLDISGKLVESVINYHWK